MLTQTIAYKPASALRGIANGLVLDEFPLETAQTLPVPVWRGSTLGVVTLYYDQPYTPDAPPYLVYPPHHRLILHATTGELLRFETITPATLGLHLDPHVAIEDPGIDPALIDPESWRDVGRFLDISPLIWYAYTVKQTRLSPDTERLVREYAALFQRMHKPIDITFYKAAAPDFFAWLARYIP
jgi:hypothetical protein